MQAKTTLNETKRHSTRVKVESKQIDTNKSIHTACKIYCQKHVRNSVEDPWRGKIRGYFVQTEKMKDKQMSLLGPFSPTQSYF
jgi:hypothetical protein